MRWLFLIIFLIATADAEPKPTAPPPIKVAYDAEHLDLDKRELQFKLSRTADAATLVVIGDDGKDLAKAALDLKGKPANTWIPITWTQPSNSQAMILRLRVASEDGRATNVELIPWSVTVDHEDVNFPSDSAKLEASEVAKLDATLVKITEVVKKSDQFVKLRLYIAGHTDTVGPSPKNRKLSIDRAAAIGKYFRSKGLTIPIAFAGFGEEVLKAKTADNVDERINRRADYVLGPAAGAPPFKGAYLKVKVGWSQLP